MGQSNVSRETVVSENAGLEFLDEDRVALDRGDLKLPVPHAALEHLLRRAQREQADVGPDIDDVNRQVMAGRDVERESEGAVVLAVDKYLVIDDPLGVAGETGA